MPNHEFDHPDAYPVDFTLEDRVRFHVARGVAKASKISDGDRMLTLLKKRFVRFNVYVDQETGEVSNKE